MDAHECHRLAKEAHAPKLKQKIEEIDSRILKAVLEGLFLTNVPLAGLESFQVSALESHYEAKYFCTNICYDNDDNEESLTIYWDRPMNKPQCGSGDQI